MPSLPRVFAPSFLLVVANLHRRGARTNDAPEPPRLLPCPLRDSPERLRLDEGLVGLEDDVSVSARADRADDPFERARSVRPRLAQGAQACVRNRTGGDGVARRVDRQDDVPLLRGESGVADLP